MSAATATLRTTTKPEMLERGQWRAEAAGDGDTAGFWLNGLYSPWTTWAQLAKDFLRARKSPERMQTFTNTVLAETFQQAGATKTDAQRAAGAARAVPRGPDAAAGRRADYRSARICRPTGLRSRSWAGGGTRKAGASPISCCRAIRRSASCGTCSTRRSR